ncbi:MAG TPA: carbamoyltransferase HypF, partial [Phycisphaerae bacterium]
MQRWVIEVEGIVQGVGFRPFVHGLAKRMGIKGFVRNQASGVRIEAEGEPGLLAEFLKEMEREPPPAARIAEVRSQEVNFLGDDDFRIVESVTGIRGKIVIAPDSATCAECLRELWDTENRRFGHPFLNCTHCGPRLTIVQGVPYDRERTTMAGFTMCASCRAEYENPADRRFHAQPTACPKCGPSLFLLDSDGRKTTRQEPLALFAAALRAGKIGAVKGLGGYHLTCDAGNSEAVAQLRRRKQREEKPFALMLADIAAVEKWCVVSPKERELLMSRQAPIVLLQKRDAAKQAIAQEVAPGNPYLGVMLPSTALHHLLMRSMEGVPLVMTSGNRRDEPIAMDEEGAAKKLAGIAEMFLAHDRGIHVRCDDSVVRVVGEKETIIRRSRGYAPEPVRIPLECEGILAVGGQMKGTFALGSGRQAIVSHHLGDLDHLEAYLAFERDARLYEQLFEMKVRCLARDLHPDYASTRYATRRAEAENLPCVAVQHHHAHMASCMAEHGLNERVIGVTFDGTGYGTDGAIWGGEFLVGDYASVSRAAHLRYVAMPGGEKAAREPWRMALAHLMDAGINDSAFEKRVTGRGTATLRQMIQRNINCPRTSSMGRLFDAVAALTGIRDVASFEGQAAMELEWAAERENGE